MKREFLSPSGGVWKRGGINKCLSLPEEEEEEEEEEANPTE